uniref:Putative RNA ligase n=1 Tax=viral metagenome TaxID=1070528 RepID=A0A6M3K2W6_9ZZZZ
MEYHKIETLFERDEKTHKLKEPLVLRNPAYDLIKKWQFTEKIDGTNIRCIWNNSTMTFAGRTDKAQLPANLVKRLYEILSPEKFLSVFPDCGAVIYGEGYGAGIQKGGLYSPTQDFAVFDVLVDGRWWLNWENTVDVAQKLGLQTVPFIIEAALDTMTIMVKLGFPSHLGTAIAEGVVGRTSEPLFDKRGHRLIIKLKTRDFATL